MKKLSKSLQINKATIANLTGSEMSRLQGGGRDTDLPTGDTGTGPTGDTTTEETWDTIWGGCSEANTHCEGCDDESVEYSACDPCNPTVTGEETIVPPCEG